MTRPAWGGLVVVRGLLVAVGAGIVVLATLVSWPWAGFGPSPDERRIADLQRLSHAIDVYRKAHDVLPATLTKLPRDPAAPVHTFDPITNRPYDYRPLGPLAYELCARFDGALADQSRGFWWHDAGRQCFSLEMRDARPRPVASPAPPPPPTEGPSTTPPAAPAPEGAGAPATPP